MYRRNEILKTRYYGALFILAGLLFSLAVPANSTAGAKADRPAGLPDTGESRPAKERGYGQTSLLFEANKGQMEGEAKFAARAKGYTLYLAASEAVFSMKTAADGENDVLRMRFAGANAVPAVEGRDEAVTRTNYYIGKKRFEGVPNFRRVSYKNLYEGIDAIFYGDPGKQLEYDFVVAPGADAGRIALDFEGAESVSVNGRGDLVIKTAGAELVQRKPFSYQQIDGQKQEISSRYVVSEPNTVKFELGEYDASKPLVIDPVLTYLTYIGGNEFDEVNDVAVDSQGNAYITGAVESLNFHGQQRSANDEAGVFAAKLNAAGAGFEYITILEGNRSDLGTAIAVGPGNTALLTGGASRDFPTTPGAYDDNLGGGGDAFLAKLNASGALQFSTYFGGNAGQDLPNDLAVDATGRAYIAGTTISGLSFPKVNEFQGCGAGGYATNTYDAYLTVFNSTGTNITYSTCLGGGGPFFYEDAFSVALDSSNNAYVAGRTNAPGFPVKNAFQPEKAGGIDAFVAKFNPAASGDASLVYSTFLGGSGTDTAKGIAVDADGRAYVTGFTGSSNFPLQGAFDSLNQVNEAFVTVLNSSGTALQNSSFLGGSGADSGNNIALGPNGLIYVTGFTESTTTFPVSPQTFPFQAANAGGQDAFIAKLRFSAGVITSSFLGGSRNDQGNAVAVRGNFIFVAGETESDNLATTPGVVKTASNASADISDGFVAKILDTHVDSVGVFHPQSSYLLTQSTANVIGQQPLFTSGLAGKTGVAGDWDGDGIDTIGSFTDGTWKVRNVNFPIILAPPVTTIAFGKGGDLPVSGDWNGDGIDTPGIFRPSTGQFTLTDVTGNSNPPFTNHVTVANFGTNGDIPISGDWDGDGKDSIAVYRPSVGQTFFTNADLSVRSNAVQNPPVDFVAFLGLSIDLPFAGDWNGDGKDSLGLYRPSTTEMILSDDNIDLIAVFAFGQIGDQPIAGDWDGKPNP